MLSKILKNKLCLWHLTWTLTWFSVVGILSFASCVYICETELAEEIPQIYKNMTIFIKPNTTWTFPECFWWGLMTITTVGYDINPNVRWRKELELLTPKIHCIPKIFTWHESLLSLASPAFETFFSIADLSWKSVWRSLCNCWSVYLDTSHPNCCQQVTNQSSVISVLTNQNSV